MRQAPVTNGYIKQASTVNAQYNCNIVAVTCTKAYPKPLFMEFLVKMPLYLFSSGQVNTIASPHNTRAIYLIVKKSIVLTALRLIWCTFPIMVFAPFKKNKIECVAHKAEKFEGHSPFRHSEI